MDECTICRGNLQLISKHIVTFRANLRSSNIKVGKVLQQTGWDVGEEAMWNTRRCCMPCYQILGRWNTARGNVGTTCAEWKERTGRSLPGMQVYERLTAKSKIIQSIKHSQYERTFSLLRLSKAACKVWRKNVGKTIRKEMSSLSKIQNLFPDSGSKKEEFDWHIILDTVKSKAPTFFAACLAAISRQNPSSSFQNLMRSRLGMMVLIPLYHRKPRLHRALPVSVASTLWRCGTKGKVISSLRGLGVATSVTTARREADKQINEADGIISSWKTSIEKENTIATCEGAAAATSITGSAIPEPDAKHVDAIHPGFSVVSDNTQFSEQRTHVTSESQGTMRIVANSYAVKNRISFRDIANKDILKASDQPIMTYLPSQEDFEELRKRMCVLVERILKDNLDMFGDESVVMHIPHEYSKESSQKSEYVNLGIIEENPNTTGGMLKILTKLAKYIPEGFHIPLHGDQRTVEVASSSKIAASTVPTPKNRLRELIPVPQDFHFRSIVIRDMVAALFTPTRHNEEGTLRHLKEYFGHKNVNDKVSSINHTDDFFLFIACAFVVGFALQTLKDNPTLTRDIAGPSTSTCTPSLSVVADEVVRQIWHQIPMNRVADVVNATTEGYDDQLCFCKEEIEGAQMVECSNFDCANGRWFHEECVMNPMTDETEWYCTPACESSDNGLHCVCRKKSESPLNWKCGNENCERGLKFHHRCVRTILPVTQGTWYCSDECSEVAGGKKTGDGLLDYMKRCAWQSLFSESIRDAEREADGAALMRYWRISMPEFYHRGHNKYVAVGHRMLSGVAGCFPPRVAHEIVHNRTINLHGGLGRNLALDFFMEQLNHKAKEMLRHTRGVYTTGTIARAGKLSGSLGTNLDKFFSQRICLMQHIDSVTSPKSTGIPRFQRYKMDVMKFSEKFGHLFKEVEGRIITCHQYKELSPNQSMSMKKTLCDLNKKIDKEAIFSNLSFPQFRN